MRAASSSARALPLSECRIRASLLLKSLRSEESPRAIRAAERLRALPVFAALSAEALRAAPERVRLKHALDCIAHEQGHGSWRELKHARETTPPRFAPEAFLERQGSAFLKRWFSTHAEARAVVRAEGGGVLFAFGHQFFIGEPDFLRALGVDVTDPDWARVGPDWTQPEDAEARARLEHKLIALGYASH
jgi:hypothetical protein